MNASGNVITDDTTLLTTGMSLGLSKSNVVFASYTLTVAVKPADENSSTPSSESSTSASSSDTTSHGTPATGSALPMAAIGMLIVSAGCLVISKSKKKA